MQSLNPKHRLWSPVPARGQLIAKQIKHNFSKPKKSLRSVPFNVSAIGIIRVVDKEKEDSGSSRVGDERDIKPWTSFCEVGRKVSFPE
jgi:hypothetical protein